MPSNLIEFQLRVRDKNDSTDVLTATSVRGGTNPYLAGAPTGEGAALNPYTGKITSGALTGRVIDPITGGTSRLFTSLMEDANNRQQLGQRKAYWEFRVDGGAWQTLYGGRLSRYALATDVEWDVAVSDWMRAEHEYKVFDQKPDETLKAYLTRWPNRGCIIGGPILGDFREIKDLGGWEFKVMESGNDFGTDYARLEFVRGFLPNGVAINTLADDVLDRVNKAAAPYMVGTSRFVDEPGFGPIEVGLASFPSLAVIINDDGGSGTVRDNPKLAVVVPSNLFAEGRFPLLSARSGSHNSADGSGAAARASRGSLFLQGTLTALGLPGSPLTVGQVVKITVVGRKVSAESPIYWTGHPGDFLTKLWDDVPIPYKASSVTGAGGIKELIGGTARITLRIDHSWNLGDIAEQAVYGIFGVGARAADDVANAGKLEAFCSRIILNTLPAVTITDADVIQSETRAFDLDAEAAIRHVNSAHTRLVYGKDVGSSELFVTQSERIERDNDDPDAIGTGEITYEVPGMVHFLDSTDINFRRWCDARAREIFDRLGRGPIGLETILIRGGAGDSVKLGQEILVNLKQLPNKNKRLVDDGTVGARAMQVVKLTPLARGKQVRLEDSGANANAIATVPTHTIAASTAVPKNIAELTITNAATLNASSYAVRIQMTVTTGAAPTVTDYTDALFYKGGAVPTAAIGLPAVIAGRTVYARARTEKAGSRPSNWSVGVGVSLTSFNAPTALTATQVAGDGSQEDLAWTIGANAANCITDVYLRPSGAAANTAVKRITLPAGSTAYRLDGLTPNTAYTAGVQHRDPTRSDDLSSTTEVTFTTANATVTLAAPINAAGFSGSIGLGLGNRTRIALYGIVVSAREFPSDVEVQEAIETGVGTGVYGSFASVGIIPAVAGDWTRWDGFAPNNKLRRQLKARHVRDGATASAFSASVTVTPWTVQAIPTYPIGAPTARVTFTSRTRQNEVISLDGTIGTNDPGPFQWRYKIGTAAYTGYSSAALPQSLTVARSSYYSQDVLVEVKQADGQVATASYTVPARTDDSVSRPLEDSTRSRFGGLATPRGFLDTLAQYTDDGTTPLVDPVLGRITTNLDDPNGNDLFGGRMRAGVKKTATQSLTTGTPTTVQFDAEDYDPNAMHSNVTNNTRLTIPTGGNVGIWVFQATVSFAANGTGRREIGILKNGTLMNGGFVRHVPLAADALYVNLVVFDNAPAVGDYYEVQALQTSGGNLNIGADCIFAATHLT